MTICGSDMSGMASRGAVRRAYTLPRVASATASQINRRRRSSASMMLVFMTHGAVRAAGLQLVFRVDEEAAERDDFIAGFETVKHLRVQLALQACVNLRWNVVARMLLHIDDAPVAFL